MFSRACLVLALCPALALAADAPATGFIDKTFKNADGTTSPYVVFVPKDYDGKKDYPVLLFLHGAGETKTEKKGGKMPVEVGLGPAIKKREKDFPFIVVIPRAEGFGWGADTANAKRALAMLDEVAKEYKVDAKRQYLTGLSMGGMGTWSIATAMPDRFAAIVPICGRGDPKAAEKLKNLPVWAFHGDADTTVKVEGSRDMIEAIKKAGGSPKYTEYPKVGHNSWDAAYGTDDLYTWLLEQKTK
ncbi:Putative peptidase OS=Singulisphaera acidiphila (strain ATCC BAA-1392 / DSM 18658 / VKM B-2454 / MOB10) GN=Sinac_7486 PE=4 SV=1: Abhydrolase_5 [Gemmataceae bacterium]|nr:Putative peptidase OS=Singulisphaera acidiphila (strain ATCC BAA-1392 / DSM 18658 / VKM B-2454 / MOB10) GN=Sinac_7486 PE=4 SV=1: Abhydrolase_5 [Gemmataceae bacterium]VTT96920.1 Putative peptidase OS=Singulisphaera acidiphila (strain ATCC BAA-1392 / DSM 18658 / VKM B-2454 / MOB10) GN=Sinac_7486 PE=4 SV=1: Abhydrolase_5 [Gemmataceae bacterium]